MELKHIGRYDIKSLIGQGGMSAVYLGYDPRALREVAIKVLPPYYLHAPKFRERFEREALTIALLEHPAIVPVYDMGEDDGQPYIVMRYMSGGSLSERLKQGPLSLKESAEMILRLAPALDTAHARGVIHRDVKPDNLLFDKYNNVFLSDFGLARLRETLGFANISDGSILGTPAYMSPEQIQGDHEIDGRTDIYSMGVVLYHMLCGSVPFNGTTAASVMMMHLINTVPQVHEHNASLPAAVQTVLDTAMAKNPDDRYQTAGEFARALQAVSAGFTRKRAAINSTAAKPQGSGKRPTLVFPPPESAQPSTRTAGQAANPPTGTQSGQPIPRAVPPGEAGAMPSQPEITLSLSASQPDTSSPKGVAIPLWAWMAGLAILVILTFSLVQASRGGFPFSGIFSPSLNPATNPTSGTTASTTAFASGMGRADMLAFLNASEVWASSLDGSSLAQLTSDGAQKSSLHWTPDGQSVLYTSAGCIRLVGLQTKQILNLACFPEDSPLTGFDISPDGKNAALVFSQSDLYLFPYSQLFHLRQSARPADLSSSATCSNFAPYHLPDVLKAIRWTPSSGRLALLLSKSNQGILRDEVSLQDFSQCAASPLGVKEIPSTYFLFSLPGYYQQPEISSLAWDGKDQLLLSGSQAEGGFGSMLLYDLARNRSQVLSPNGDCCYRDARWSPDGAYLFYAYRSESGNQVSLYYASFAQALQAGAVTNPLQFPANFFSAPLESFQPALREAP